MTYEARQESPMVGGWCVIEKDSQFYVHFPHRALAMAFAALMNRDVKTAAEYVEQWRTN